MNLPDSSDLRVIVCKVLPSNYTLPFFALQKIILQNLFPKLKNAFIHFFLYYSTPAHHIQSQYMDK